MFVHGLGRAAPSGARCAARRAASVANQCRTSPALVPTTVRHYVRWAFRTRGRVFLGVSVPLGAREVGKAKGTHCREGKIELEALFQKPS